jgi:hypothetical protein
MKTSLLLLLTAYLGAQTFILQAQVQVPSLSAQPGSTQDNSLAAITKPAAFYLSVAALPPTCTISSLAWVLNTTAGQNLYGCTSANTWTLETGGGGGGGVTSVTGTNGVTCGGTTAVTCSADTTYLNVRYAQLSAANTFLAQQTFSPTVSTNATHFAGHAINGSGNQSNDFDFTNASQPFFFDAGVNINYLLSLPGSGVTPPSVPAAGCATWDGTHYYPGSAACGGMAIGGAVTGGTSTAALYVDASGNLAQQPGASGSQYSWNPSTQILTAGRFSGSTTPATAIGQYLTNNGAFYIANAAVLWGDGNSYTVVQSPNGTVGFAPAGNQLAQFTTTGHLRSIQFAIPVLTGCGTSPAINSAATDIAGTVTEGSVATGCVITFGSAYSTAPNCTVSSLSGLGFSYTVSTSAITVTNIGALSSTKLAYTCIQN